MDHHHPSGNMAAAALCNSAVTGFTSYSPALTNLPAVPLGSWALCSLESSLPGHSRPHLPFPTPPMYRGLTFTTLAFASLSGSPVATSSMASVSLRCLRGITKAGSCQHSSQRPRQALRSSCLLSTYPLSLLSCLPRAGVRARPLCLSSRMASFLPFTIVSISTFRQQAFSEHRLHTFR